MAAARALKLIAPPTDISVTVVCCALTVPNPLRLFILFFTRASPTHTHTHTHTHTQTALQRADGQGASETVVHLRTDRDVYQLHADDAVDVHQEEDDG